MPHPTASQWNHGGVLSLLFHRRPQHLLDAVSDSYLRDAEAPRSTVLDGHSLLQLLAYLTLLIVPSSRRF